MSWERPTLAELVERIETDITGRLLEGQSLLRRSVLGVLARVLAGAVHLLYGYISWAHEQQFVDSSESEYLDRQASIWGISRTAATYAAGSVTVTGTDGTVVPAGTELLRSDEVSYLTDADATISGGTATVDVTAQEAGEECNTEAGVALSFVSPVSGANATATVAAGGIVDGQDEEGDDSLRARVLARIQAPPHGGCAADYVAWALAVDGVAAAWCFPLHLGVGTVGVYFTVDDDDPIPDAAKVAEVQDYMDELRPVTADLAVLAPVPVEMDFTLSVTPDTSAVRAAVEAELAALILRVAEPGATILLTHVHEAISTAAGETDHELTSPAADVALGTGEYPVLGTVTWS